MERRHFIQTSGLALGSVLIGKTALAANSEKAGDLIGYPDKITALFSGKEVSLMKSGTGKWDFEMIADKHMTEADWTMNGYSLTNPTFHFGTTRGNRTRTKSIYQRMFCTGSVGFAGWRTARLDGKCFPHKVEPEWRNGDF